MIASLRGTVLEREAESVVVEAGGVGYELQVTAHTLAALPAIGAEARLLTRQIVREDAHLLFGFATAEERRVFDLLIAVNGVGPRLAIAALSGLDPPALARAIRDEDVAALVALPGIGRKTAERLIVELRDKLEFIPVAGRPATGRGRAGRPRDEREADAVAALTALGLTAAQAQEIVRQAAADLPDAPLEALVREALSRLGRSAALVR